MKRNQNSNSNRTTRKYYFKIRIVNKSTAKTGLLKELKMKGSLLIFVALATTASTQACIVDSDCQGQEGCCKCIKYGAIWDGYCNCTCAETLTAKTLRAG
mmetsp:Transcript_39722/g.64500  ORF Transcript_39722/g.64500 Transcript_39722/m.64500 type:complete len:100 (-) Transcript_39722:25-324(-)